jgi:nucleotide-binding universal stress UspA family protein
MTASIKPFIVVVGIDYSTASDLALERAFRLCENESLSTLHVVNVTRRAEGLTGVDEPQRFEPKKVTAEAEVRLQDYIGEKTAALRAEGRKTPWRILYHVRWDAPGDEIAQLAADVEADLVVVGTHGRRGLTRMLLGSVAEAVVRLAPCPVLVERPKGVLNVPAIEPPCSECLKARNSTAGATYWCAQHSEHHGQRHTYRSTDRHGAGSTLPSFGW